MSCSAAARKCSTRAWRACALIVLALSACSSKLAAPLAPASPRAPAAAVSAEPSAHDAKPTTAGISVLVQEPRPRTNGAPRQCAAADWSPRALAPLLAPGKVAAPSQSDQQSARVQVFDSECTDSPVGATEESPTLVVVDGVELGLASALPAGSSKRGWVGNQCSLDVKLADGSGRPTRLGAAKFRRLPA